MKVAGYVVAIILYSLKVWFKSILILLKYRSYSRGLFLLAHSVGCSDLVTSSSCFSRLVSTIFLLYNNHTRNSNSLGSIWQ